MTGSASDQMWSQTRWLSVGAKFGVGQVQGNSKDKKNCVLRTSELKANSKAEVELTEL